MDLGERRGEVGKNGGGETVIGMYSKRGESIFN